MEEWDVPALEVIIALLLLIGDLSVVSVLLNRETGLFYFAVGGDLLRWK